MKYLFFILFFLNCFSKDYDNKLDISVIHSGLFNLSDIIDIHWKSILSEILQQNSFFLDAINPNSVVLVNMVNNNTNGVLQTAKITNILIDLIINNISNCNVISMEKLYQAYRYLDISSEEIIKSYIFSIEIAHILKADYIIYSIVYGDIDQPNIQLQLILSKTGEILRSVNKLINCNDLIYN